MKRWDLKVEDIETLLHRERGKKWGEQIID